MFKILILVLVIVGVGFIAYDQGSKNTPSQDVNEVDAREEDNNDAPATDVSKVNTNTTDASPAVSAGQVLNLSGQGLVQVPMDVFDKTGTEELDLSGNKLTGSLQAEVRHLQNLKVLNLANNQFTGIPAEIGQLKKLEVLDLSNNRITGLPLEIGNLTNLRVLNLKGNEYSKYDLGLIKEKLPAATVIEVD